MRDKEMTGLGGLSDGRDLFAVSFHHDQVRRRREISIPEIMADSLVMPTPLTGGSRLALPRDEETAYRRRPVARRELTAGVILPDRDYRR